MQKSHNNYYANSELNPLLGVNNGNSQPNAEFFKYNMPINGMSRNTADRFPQNQNGLDSQQYMQSLLGQTMYNSELNRNNNMNSYVGNNMGNMFGNYNQFTKVDVGAGYDNSSLLNQYNKILPQFNNYNNDYGVNLTHELLRKRMRDNDLVNEIISPNLNNKLGECNWNLSNQARDLPSNSADIRYQTPNILNSKNVIYNSIQPNNSKINVSHVSENESKQK